MCAGVYVYVWARGCGGAGMRGTVGEWLGGCEDGKAGK